MNDRHGSGVVAVAAIRLVAACGGGDSRLGVASSARRQAFDESVLEGVWTPVYEIVVGGNSHQKWSLCADVVVAEHYTVAWFPVRTELCGSRPSHAGLRGLSRRLLDRPFLFWGDTGMVSSTSTRIQPNDQHDRMGALDGITVVEAGVLIQGPQAAALLSHWGARVIKVELPGLGDMARWLPAGPGATQSAVFAGCNRGKRSVTIDLRISAGREVFRRLAATADVVITNFTPGTMEKWRLGYDEVAARNPRVIYATASTFGPSGPDAERPGADLSGQALGGLISTIGTDAGEPTPVGATIADHIGSQNLAAGVLAALFARERTGRGQRVDTSLLGGQIWAQASEYNALLLTGNPVGRANRDHSLIPGLYGIFPTADGWIAIVGVLGPDRPKFFATIGRPELAERFPQPLYWRAEKTALFPILDEVFTARPTAEWCAMLTAAELRCAPVRNHAEALADAGARMNGYFVEVDGAEGPITLVAPPVRFSDTPARASASLPELGQHSEEVLVELGYNWEEIAKLATDGAI